MTLALLPKLKPVNTVGSLVFPVYFFLVGSKKQIANTDYAQLSWLHKYDLSTSYLLQFRMENYLIWQISERIVLVMGKEKSFFLCFFSHSGPGMNRASYAHLYQAGFANILDRQGETPEVIDPSDHVNLHPERENKDSLQCNEIIVRFLAVSRQV